MLAGHFGSNLAGIDSTSYIVIRGVIGSHTHKLPDLSKIMEKDSRVISGL